ncbi:hypothetical protein PENSPDRAFT_500876 [Peniophora sp. CONT]|nr:hypothetical protein PENSPDRAFT_500876 [Peniophora sp. CONT]
MGEGIGGGGGGSIPNEFLVMGYIAMSLGPENANKLFNKFVGSLDFSSVPAGIIRYQDSSYRATARPEIVLDYHVDSKGTIVRQTMWQPLQNGDVIRHFRDATIRVPVFFIGTDNVIGVDMSHATRSGGALNIFHPNVPAPLGGVAATNFCIKWPGYTQEYKKKVELRVADRTAITMSKLVERVARFVEHFLEEAASWQIDPGCQYWRVGPGAITKDKLYIVGLVHVSAGTWQPILQLKHLNFH